MTETPPSRRNFLAAAAAGAGLLAASRPGEADAAESATPGRIDEAISVRDFGARLDGKSDDSSAVQAAIDAAQARIERLGGAAQTVVFPPGSCVVTRPIVWKSCALLGVDPGVSSRLLWGGADGGGPALHKPRGFPGGGWSNRLENLSLEPRASNAQPAAWLRIDEPVDKFFLLRRVRFKQCRRDAIVLTRGWINLHWEHLRWDDIGGFAIRAVAGPRQNLSSFIIESFTYDHSIRDSRSSGFALFDNPHNESNLGTVTFRGARIEVNTPWAGNAALVTYHSKQTLPPRSIGLMLQDIDYQSSGGMDDSLLHLDVPGGGGRECLILMNCRVGGLRHVTAGNWAANQVLTPVPEGGRFGLTLINAGDLLQFNDRLVVAGSGLGVGNSLPASAPGSVARKIEVFDAEGRSLGFVAVYDRID